MRHDHGNGGRNAAKTRSRVPPVVDRGGSQRAIALSSSRSSPARLREAGLFLCPVHTRNDVIEVHKMTNIVQLEPPRTRDDFELVRGGREGTYWQSADGLLVRVAGVEGG